MSALSLFVWVLAMGVLPRLFRKDEAAVRESSSVAGCKRSFDSVRNELMENSLNMATVGLLALASVAATSYAATKQFAADHFLRDEWMMAASGFITCVPIAAMLYHLSAKDRGKLKRDFALAKVELQIAREKVLLREASREVGAVDVSGGVPDFIMPRHR